MLALQTILAASAIITRQMRKLCSEKYSLRVEKVPVVQNLKP